MKEQLRKSASFSPEQTLKVFSKAINDSCIENDLWKRWHCKVTGHRFQVYVLSGSGVSSRFPIIAAQGEVLQKENGSEIVFEFHWGSLIRYFVWFLVLMCLIFAVVALVMKQAVGASLASSVTILHFLFAGYLLLYVLLFVPPWLFVRREMGKALKLLEH